MDGLMIREIIFSHIADSAVYTELNVQRDKCSEGTCTSCIELNVLWVDESIQLLLTATSLEMKMSLQI